MFSLYLLGGQKGKEQERNEVRREEGEREREGGGGGGRLH